MTSTHSIPTVEQLQAELARVKAESSEAIRSRDRKITALREQAQRATEVERERCARIVRRFRTGAEESKTLFARAKDDKMTLYCGGAFLALSDALTRIESGETA